MTKTLTVVHCIYGIHVCAAVINCTQQYIHVCGAHLPSSIFMTETDSISISARIDRSGDSQQNMTSHCAGLGQTKVVACLLQYYAHAGSMHPASSSWTRWTALVVPGVTAVVVVAVATQRCRGPCWSCSTSWTDLRPPTKSR